MKLIKFIIPVFYLIFVQTIYAVQDIGLSKDKLPGGIEVTGEPGTILGSVLKNTIGIFFAVGAIGFTIMIIWGAVDWIISGGDKEKVAGARKRITTAVVGLVLLSLSFVIMVIFGQVLNIEFLQTGTFIIPTLNKP